jgi:hypothetical protein
MAYGKPPNGRELTPTLIARILGGLAALLAAAAALVRAIDDLDLL